LTTVRKWPWLWPPWGRRKIVDLTAEEIARATAGKILSGSPLSRAEGVCSDSRQLHEGELFIPLKGPRFDGHSFVTDAMSKGAAGSLVQRGRVESAGDLNFPGKFFVAVEDVLQALGDLAHFWRARQPSRVVAITGSNGKTTTKEMTARILSKTFNVLKTEGNLNNLIGLPLMLLRLSPVHDVAVLEMGMSEPGEIRRLKAIADPQVSLITNIGYAHIEFLRSLEGVAQAKGELWEGLRKEDWIAVNLDDPRVAELAAPARCVKKTFGIMHEADVRAGDLFLEGQRGIRFSLRMGGMKRSVGLAAVGRHNVYNALAAATLAAILGLNLEEIGTALEGFQPFPGRGEVIRLRRNVYILDDSYNSNPDSLQATLSAFAETKGKNRGLLVLGDMLELGPGSAAAHEEAGERIGEMRVEHLFLLGDQAQHLAEGAKAAGMKEQKVHVARNREEVLEGLEKVVEAGDWILVKGSRRMQMERIIEGLADCLGRA
jgi:UDP-N-acetylmuramoyl-tripeptide--D-alanyl-D-alanine ligase